MAGTGTAASGRKFASIPAALGRFSRTNGPMALLYRELRGVGLNETNVFHVREAVLDRGELRIYLTDGTIAFTTTSVDG